MWGTLILASASPRRRELMAQAGFTFVVRPAEIDETPRSGEIAETYVLRLATEKARAVLSRTPAGEEVTILAADTAVVLGDGTILGKPQDSADATRMLGLLSGRTHSVMTGLAVVSSSGAGVFGVELTQVSFSQITPGDIAAYVSTGEPMDKAGAYAIQGFAARWIPRIEGDYFNVVGLPLARTVAMLGEVQRQGTSPATVSEMPHCRAGQQL